MKHNLKIAEMRVGYDLHTFVGHSELAKSIDKKVFDIVVERLAEDLYNKHKEQILDSMSLKSLIKATYKKLEKDIYLKMRSVLK